MNEAGNERGDSLLDKKSAVLGNRFTEGTKQQQSSTQDSFNLRNLNLDGISRVFLLQIRDLSYSVLKRLRLPLGTQAT